MGNKVDLYCILLLCCFAVNRSGAKTWMDGRKPCRDCWPLVSRCWTSHVRNTSCRWPRKSKGSETDGRTHVSAPSNARYSACRSTTNSDICGSHLNCTVYWFCFRKTLFPVWKILWSFVESRFRSVTVIVSRVGLSLKCLIKRTTKKRKKKDVRLLQSQYIVASGDNM